MGKKIVIQPIAGVDDVPQEEVLEVSENTTAELFESTVVEPDIIEGVDDNLPPELPLGWGVYTPAEGIPQATEEQEYGNVLESIEDPTEEFTDEQAEIEYFSEDDDEAVLQMAEVDSIDEVLHRDRDGGVFESLEGIISFRVDGLYKPDDKNYKSTNALRKDPPVLLFASPEGEEVEVQLTRSVTNALIANLNDVQKAHMGYKKVEKSMKIKDLPEVAKTFPEKIKALPGKIADYFLEKPAKAIVLGIFIVLVLWGIIGNIIR